MVFLTVVTLQLNKITIDCITGCNNKVILKITMNQEKHYNVKNIQKLDEAIV